MATVSLTVRTEHRGDAVVVSPTGQLDIRTASLLREPLRQPAASSRLVLDLSGLSFIDSSGLKLLIESQADADHAHASFRIVVDAAAILRQLAVAGIADRLSLAATLDAALSDASG